MSSLRHLSTRPVFNAYSVQQRNPENAMLGRWADLQDTGSEAEE